MSMWSFKINRAPYGRLKKTQGLPVLPQRYEAMGVNYCDTYSPVVNWTSVRSMITLSILRELHTKSVNSFLAYNQADVETEIFMELLIGFVVEGE